MGTLSLNNFFACCVKFMVHDVRFSSGMGLSSTYSLEEFIRVHNCLYSRHVPECLTGISGEAGHIYGQLEKTFLIKMSQKSLLR